MYQRFEELGRRVYRRLQDRRRHSQQEKRRRRIESILSRTEPPRLMDSREDFDRLQAEYQPRNGAANDCFSTWWLGMRRASWLIPLAKIQTPGARVLDAACGDGMTGYALDSYRHNVTLHDLEDGRDERAKTLPFVAGDLAAPLPLEPESFDLIFSYNAFEHIADPAAALVELVRLCRKNGLIYLDFGPLYTSPWGLHASKSLYMPYPQFLFTPELIDRKIRDLQPPDSALTPHERHPLNRWTLGRFEQAWSRCGCEVVSVKCKDNPDSLDVIELFPEAFQGRGLGYRDVTAEQVAVTLRKPV